MLNGNKYSAAIESVAPLIHRPKNVTSRKLLTEIAWSHHHLRNLFRVAYFMHTYMINPELKKN